MTCASLYKAALNYTKLQFTAFEPIPEGKIRRNVIFVAFWCVFLSKKKKRFILKVGVISSPLNSSEKSEFQRITSHDQDQEYNFLI